MNAFNHIAFNCRELAAQEAFYTKHFGFKRSRTFNRGEPNEFFMLKLGAMRLELFQGRHADTPSSKGFEQVVGFRHLALDVEKLEPIIEALRADGVEPDAIIDCKHVTPELRIVFFRDPEGNIIELMEGYRDEE
jgi:glyoxylase I family protein